MQNNLAAVLGPAGFWETHRRCLALFRNYAQMLTDSYKIHLGRPLSMDVESVGRTPELVQLIRERGGIMATGHIGLWQVGPFLAEWRELPTFYMARAEGPTRLFSGGNSAFAIAFASFTRRDRRFRRCRLPGAARKVAGRNAD